MRMQAAAFICGCKQFAHIGARGNGRRGQSPSFRLLAIKPSPVHHHPSRKVLGRTCGHRTLHFGGAQSLVHPQRETTTAVLGRALHQTHWSISIDRTATTVGKPKARSGRPRRARPRGRPVLTACEQRPQRGPQQQPFVFFLEESFLDLLPFTLVTVSYEGPVVLVTTSEPGIVCTIIVLLAEISAGFVCA